ncbi:hypothetical protein, partial [Citrobacter cronae]|uniref:hypothetical protein n=1 Tax=Citrobacter cronae TaxID=1748967 RepID=UPI0038886CAF
LKALCAERGIVWREYDLRHSSGGEQASAIAEKVWASDGFFLRILILCKNNFVENNINNPAD